MWPYLGPPWTFPTQFGLWMFFIMLHRYMVSKTLKCEKSFLWCHCFCTLYWCFKLSDPTLRAFFQYQNLVLTGGEGDEQRFQGLSMSIPPLICCLQPLLTILGPSFPTSDNRIRLKVNKATVTNKTSNTEERWSWVFGNRVCTLTYICSF